jgi:hypothetical protein
MVVGGRGGGGLEVYLKRIWSGGLVESCLMQVETWIDVAVVILEKGLQRGKFMPMYWTLMEH